MDEYATRCQPDFPVQVGRDQGLIRLARGRMSGSERRMTRRMTWWDEVAPAMRADEGGGVDQRLPAGYSAAYVINRLLMPRAKKDVQCESYSRISAAADEDGR